MVGNGLLFLTLANVPVVYVNLVCYEQGQGNQSVTPRWRAGLA
jgi:hypothetical protein